MVKDVQEEYALSARAVGAAVGAAGIRAVAPAAAERRREGREEKGARGAKGVQEGKGATRVKKSTMFAGDDGGGGKPAEKSIRI